MAEKVFAALILTLCLGAMVRLFIGARRRARLDAWLRGLYHWRSSRKDAARVAEEAIRRARGSQNQGNWEGNVYKPKTFKRPPKDKLH